MEIYTINPVQGATVTDMAGTQITFPANALVDANGQPPTGNIDVAIHTYNLTDESMPGDMSGINGAGQPGYLVSVGAFWAEFTGLIIGLALAVTLNGIRFYESLEAILF